MEVWSRTKVTAICVTHDVDEAILLSDRILLMSNGPRARIAESVKINIERPRSRTDIIENPAYYKIRNYLVNFLVVRSAAMTEQVQSVQQQPVVIDPSLDVVAEPDGGTTVIGSEQNRPAPAVRGIC